MLLACLGDITYGIAAQGVTQAKGRRGRRTSSADVRAVDGWHLVFARCVPLRCAEHYDSDTHTAAGSLGRIHIAKGSLAALAASSHGGADLIHNLSLWT